MNFDNWDIDMFYTEKSWDVDDLVSMAWTEDGPVRTTMDLTWKCSRSVIRQKIVIAGALCYSAQGGRWMNLNVKP